MDGTDMCRGCRHAKWDRLRIYGGPTYWIYVGCKQNKEPEYNAEEEAWECEEYKGGMTEMKQWEAAGNLHNIHWYGESVTLKEDTEEDVMEAERLLKEQLARALKLKMITIKTPMPNEGCIVSVKVGVLFSGGQDGTV